MKFFPEKKKLKKLIIITNKCPQVLILKYFKRKRGGSVADVGVEGVIKFRCLIKYQKLFDSSTIERQVKFTRVSCIIRMNFTL